MYLNRCAFLSFNLKGLSGSKGFREAYKALKNTGTPFILYKCRSGLNTPSNTYYIDLIEFNNDSNIALEDSLKEVFKTYPAIGDKPIKFQGDRYTVDEIINLVKLLYV